MIIVYGQPKGKARPRFRRIGNYVSTYTTKETRDYEKQIQDEWTKNERRYFAENVPLMVKVNAFYEIPSSWSKRKKQQAIDGIIKPCVKPDTDNVLKAVMDALNGVAYKDDKQVCATILNKIYAEIPRIEIEIKEIKE